MKDKNQNSDNGTIHLRAPICTIVGHVDHGKSSILDYIRGTNIIKGEAGGITQAIGASFITMNTIIKRSKGLIKDANKIKVPGLLFIDTPGHEAFTTLRKRGGNLADMAILVVDINEGFKPQTYEALEILKSYKTPFIIAANKIDLIPGWKSMPSKTIAQILKEQSDRVISALDENIYKIVGIMYESGMRAERFDRIKDFTKEIAIVPVSAKTGEGISELLMLLIGLAQTFLNLQVHTEGEGKGIVLELKKITGMGYVIDIILYDGLIKNNDILIISGLDNPTVTKIKSILKPRDNFDMRDKKTKFIYEKEIVAAEGLRIIAPGLDSVIAGMPLIAIRNENAHEETIAEKEAQLKSEVENVFINSDSEGVIVKADTIGSLEAMIMLLKSNNIKIRKASVGNIMKKDIFEAYSNKEQSPLYAVILGFNVEITKDAEEELEHFNVKIINHEVIYNVIDDFLAWLKDEKEKLESIKKNKLSFPAKIRIMPNNIFRKSNPAIVGVEVIAGKLTSNLELMNENGRSITRVESIQEDKKKLEIAEEGKEVAVSLKNVTVGRQVDEGTILYSVISESNFRKLKDNKQYLTENDKKLLMEIAKIMRKDNPVWGI
ncbi:MAG: translation initiation factor IF-2 [Nitrospiraceae bacterium]|nr:translation initiation factor IF-2 [Nitrospiraceae bacterium]